MSSWSISAIRDRREQLGLSQSEVAQQMGVSKSLLSHIEGGSRQPTSEQIRHLARILKVPSTLLELAGGHLPEDVKEAIHLNPVETVAAVRQRIEAHALYYPQAPQDVPQPKPPVVLHVNTLPDRILAQKTSTSYRAHSYHTKVPPEAIRPFIRSYSSAGDMVFDPFCGSGMTGVAALLEGRNALLSDLSPAAVHIARNYTTPCDPAEFARAFALVEMQMLPIVDWLYRPLSGEGLVEYTTWSDVYRCPNCSTEIVYWNLIQNGATTSDKITCEHCGTYSRKADLQWAGECPVQSHTSRGSNRIESHAPTRSELQLIEQAGLTPIPYWVPNVPFGSEREMWRAGHKSMGIESVNGFFTHRNLHALAALRHAIVANSEGRTREALMFAFTASVNRASKRYQWNAKRPTNVMTGTLYISSLRYEWNVWSLFKRKAADVMRYYKAFPDTTARADVFQRSAADLSLLPDRSIDFVFMDPPFGANIFYADASLLWDTWLGQMTDESAEIVVNKSRAAASGGKTLTEYGDLMGQAFGHVARVLRPGARSVLAFSNSNDAVWRAVQDALHQAGLETERVHMLDKGQPSIKGVKGLNGSEDVTTLDLMLCLTHASRQFNIPTLNLRPDSFTDQVVRDVLTKRDARNDEVYSAVLQAALAANYSVSGITMPSIREACIRVGAKERDGNWSLRQPMQVAQQRTSLVDGYLTARGSFPRSGNPATVEGPLDAVRIPGGRSSPFYLAHSYHTKVPPEAITPFIEHHTRPGDVVLDPFCGSGMTGVAARSAGRRVILNDLSPAAIHLAWNHTHVCEPDELGFAFQRLAADLEPIFSAMYAVPLADGKKGTAHWTLWSSTHNCPQCSGEFLLWEAIDKKSGRLGRTIDCPKCSSPIARGKLKSVGSRPAWIAYEDENGRRGERAATEFDVTHAATFSKMDIKTWWPNIAVSADREMYIRNALHLQGIKTIDDFYTARNLTALSLIWDRIGKEPNERLRRALAFAFTNTAWHGTRMRRFNARGGQRPLTGTLYIPQLSSEANVLEVMRNKISQLQKYYRAFTPTGGDLPAISLGSAAKLDSLEDASVDYIFTDPPFGSNIFYADCNLIWEAWLGRTTDTTLEAVVNRSLAPDRGGKTLAIYSEMMASSMKEMARVLKPGGWATVVFHNTDARVWEAIRDAASKAGFVFHEAASLDRQQQSHKGYKGRSGEEDVAHFDIVFNLQKTAAGEQASKHKPDNVHIETLVAEVMRVPEVVRNGLQGVHAEVMRRLASVGDSGFVDYSLVRRIFERANVMD